MLARYCLYRDFFYKKIKCWLIVSGEGWQKTLLTDAVAKDTMKRMLQPKLSKWVLKEKKHLNIWLLLPCLCNLDKTSLYYILRASDGLCFLRLDYLSAKMSRADDEGKEELKKQMDLIEKDIAGIR